MFDRFGKRMTAVMGSVMLFTGLAQTQASADPEPYTRRISGSSASGCSYAGGTVTYAFIPLGEWNGVPAYLVTRSWNVIVEDRCAEDDEQAHLQTRFTVESSVTGSYTTAWVTVASSGTLSYSTSITGLPIGSDFQVCDYRLLEGDHACRDVTA